MSVVKITKPKSKPDGYHCTKSEDRGRSEESKGQNAKQPKTLTERTRSIAKQ